MCILPCQQPCDELDKLTDSDYGPLVLLMRVHKCSGLSRFWYYGWTNAPMRSCYSSVLSKSTTQTSMQHACQSFICSQQMLLLQDYQATRVDSIYSDGFNKLFDKHSKLQNILYSRNGAYALELRGDGNLVCWHLESPYIWVGQPVWSTKSYPTGSPLSHEGPYTLVVQEDHNVCIYAEKKGNCIWASSTCRKGGEGSVCLTMHDDGRVVLYNGQRDVIWTRWPDDMASQRVWQALDTKSARIAWGLACSVIMYVGISAHCLHMVICSYLIFKLRRAYLLACAPALCT